MKTLFPIINSTVEEYGYFTIKPVLQFCLRELDLPAAAVTLVQFRNRSKPGVCGRWWAEPGGLGRVRVSVGRPEWVWGTVNFTRSGCDLTMSEKLHAVVYTLAHELQHAKNWATGTHWKLVKARQLEPTCVRAGALVLDAWRRYNSR